MRRFRIGILLIVLAGTDRAFPQRLDAVAKSVVFLQHTFIETISTDKGTLEIWLKEPNTNVFQPKMASSNGSGFLVSHSNRVFYLVTAKHVAVIMGFTDYDNVIIGAKDGKSVQGYSGAPAFDLNEPIATSGGGAVISGGKGVTCLGVVSSTISDNTGGKMAGVVPTKCILELIKAHESP